MTAIEFSSAIPVLPALDLDQSLAFYEEKLGFSRAFQYSNHAGVQRGPVQVHFWLCDDPTIPKMTSCRINVRGIDALHAQAQAHGAVHPNGCLADRPWGFREFTVLDPSGNGVVFAESLESAA